MSTKAMPATSVTRKAKIKVKGNMRYIILCIVMSFVGQVTFAQSGDRRDGVVSYLTSQNVYIKYDRTSDIQAGDTLYLAVHDRLVPAVVVQHTSSLSVMGIPIGDASLKVGDTLVYQEVQVKSAPGNTAPVPVEVPAEALPEPDVPIAPGITGQAPQSKARVQSIRGKLSVSMYQHLYGAVAPDVERLRYIFSLQARNISQSRLSADVYVSYRHQFEDWQADTASRSKALRVYSLALNYDLTDRTHITIGRKVNLNISNIGAVDGFQLEHGFGKFTAGGFYGSRPDHLDYGFNFDLKQYGGFIGFKSPLKHGYVQSSLAIVEQRNGGITDRRFAYLQHSSTLTKTLSLFASAEFDLYANVDSVADNAIHFTSTYVSLQYRPTRKLTVYGSYDARKNVIFYETYKNFIDNLIEQEMRQGLRLRATYRFIKYMTLGSSIGYRFQKDQGANSTNVHTYLTHSRIPGINASAMASLIWLKNDYTQGFVYGIRLSRDILSQKVYIEGEYRIANYQYGFADLKLHQNIVGVTVAWRIMKKLAFSVDYEGVFADQPNNRIHFNLTQRF